MSSPSSSSHLISTSVCLSDCSYHPLYILFFCPLLFLPPVLPPSFPLFILPPSLSPSPLLPSIHSPSLPLSFLPPSLYSFSLPPSLLPPSFTLFTLPPFFHFLIPSFTDPGSHQNVFTMRLVEEFSMSAKYAKILDLPDFPR